MNSIFMFFIQVGALPMLAVLRVLNAVPGLEDKFIVALPTRAEMEMGVLWLASAALGFVICSIALVLIGMLLF